MSATAWRPAKSKSSSARRWRHSRNTGDCIRANGVGLVMAPATPTIIYTDLDGTMLGKGGSLFRTAGGDFTMAGAEALQSLPRAGRGALLLLRTEHRSSCVRTPGCSASNSYIAEAGCVLVRDWGSTIILNCAPFGEGEDMSVFEEIARHRRARPAVRTVRRGSVVSRTLVPRPQLFPPDARADRHRRR